MKASKSFMQVRPSRAYLGEFPNFFRGPGPGGSSGVPPLPMPVCQETMLMGAEVSSGPT